MKIPRLLIAALRGGSGKTVMSIGIIAALSKQGKSIAPFKKGPDYIDAGWLALTAGRPCYNLDPFLLSSHDNICSFMAHSNMCDISVIEGNRGIYDGIGLTGSTSTAELAKLLMAPVVLCVDCTKITRTMAALIAGCLQFDQNVMITAVILNQIATSRHEQKLRESIEHYCGIPVVGAMPRLDHQYFPQRHLGLVPTAEHRWAKDAIDAICRVAEQHIDLGALETIARQAPGFESNSGIKKREIGEGKADDSEPTTMERHRHAERAMPTVETKRLKTGIRDRTKDRPYRRVAAKAKPRAPRIGIFKDSAFQFYYPENIDALSARGAEVVFISPLHDFTVPHLDALYIGGGFPETHARQLSKNKSFNRQLKALVEEDLPVYAECGGLMYLGNELIMESKIYPMAGVLPVAFDFYKQPQGHGYTLATVVGENPFYPVGTEIRGHEFHYSRLKRWSGDPPDLVLHMNRGVGIDKDRDGLTYHNVLATYMHVHALGTPAWAEALVRNAITYQHKKNHR